MTDRDSGRASVIEPSAFQPLDTTTSKSPQPGNSRRWLLLACAAVFLLVMFFLLSARSLQIRVNTESPARVSISGLALPFGELPKFVFS